jgi:hypothetical protein
VSATVDGARSALIVASDDYADPGLRRLRAPDSDAQALAGVLRDPEIGGFQVRTLLNSPAHEVNLAVEEFFADRRPDDLLLLHLSCHGVKDEGGELYFAASNTLLRRLGATAVAAEFVNRRMSRSRSRRIVLLLDCCYAGAFERGMTARAGSGVGIQEQLGGRGRAVITASSAMEYAFEGDELADSRELAPSVSTSALVEGLRTGEADRDQDGLVALDELYDYVYDKVRAVTPNQTPGKWAFGVQGELVIAQRARPVTVPAPLPAELQAALDSPFAAVRAAAVQELARLVRGRHAGLALGATQSLQRLVDDDSRTVATAATEALRAQTPPEPTPKEPTAPLAAAPPVPVEPTPAAQVAVAQPVAAEPTAREPVAAATEPTPAVPKAGPMAAPAQEPAVEHGGASAASGDGGLLVAGGLAIVAALLAVAALFPIYWADFRLGDLPADTWNILILAALVIGAGISILDPRTRRLVGPGLLLGAAADLPSGLVFKFTVDPSNYGTVGPGYWLLFWGQVIGTVAACLAGVSLARAGAVRLAPRLPRGALPWIVALAGAVGAAALLSQAAGQPFLPGRNLEFNPGEDLAPLVWSSTMALVVPVCAALAVPRRFGAALLAGWTWCALAILAYSTGFQTFTMPTLVFGLTVLTLAAVIVPFARAAPSPQTEPAAPG